MLLFLLSGTYGGLKEIKSNFSNMGNEKSDLIFQSYCATKQKKEHLEFPHIRYSELDGIKTIKIF